MAVRSSCLGMHIENGGSDDEALDMDETDELPRGTKHARETSEGSYHASSSRPFETY